MIKHPQTLPGRIAPATAGRLAVLLYALLVAGCTSRGVFDRGDHAPPGMVDISGIEDAVPQHEPLSRYGNPASYVVYGKRYYTKPTSKGHKERGIASWYGTKFHGQRTSSGETYDMYKMTAAHKTLPLPTYVEVKNLRNNRTIVVKVNDRGPFMHDRIIDLSFVAAAKLGIQEDGTGLVEVRALEPETPQQALQALPARQTLPQPAQVTQATTTQLPAPPALPVPAPGRAQTLPVSTPVPPAASGQAAPKRQPVQTAAVTPAAQASGPQSRPAADQAVFLQVGAYRVFKNAEHMVLKVNSHYPGNIRIAEVNDSKGTIYKVQLGPLGDLAEARRVAHDLKPHGISDSHAITR